ncbi:MAG TPA: MFS transporter [Oscillatoriaceae cyanobacterium]
MTTPTAQSSPFAGWSVLAAGTLGLMMTLPGRTAALAVFLDPMLHELHLGRSLVSALFLVATLGYTLLLPRAGRLLDRHSPRVCVGVVVVLFAIACLFSSSIHSPLTFFLALFALRALGQGALLMISQHTINLWFVARRGLAVGISGAGFAIASILFPLGIGHAIGAIGWRDTFVALGMLQLAVMLPVGLLGYRGRPEDHGLLPDGAQAPVDEDHWTRDEALRTPTFWVFAAGIVALAGVSTGLELHHFSIMAEHGLTRPEALAYFVPMGLFTALSNLGAGMAIDRSEPRRVLLAGLGLQALALVMLGHVAAGPALWLYGALQGLSLGVLATLTSAVWPHYFGRRHAGAIRGFAQMLFVFGTALGPMPFALCHQWIGSYEPVVLGSLGLLVVTGAAVGLLHPLERRMPQSSVHG